MIKQHVKQTASSISFLEVLLVVFVTLKLCGIINWSWWWVLAPFWIPALIAIPFFVWLWWVLRTEQKKLRANRLLERERNSSRT